MHGVRYKRPTEDKTMQRVFRVMKMCFIVGAATQPHVHLDLFLFISFYAWTLVQLNAHSFLYVGDARETSGVWQRNESSRWRTFEE